MKDKMDKENTQADKKARVKAWLYQWLSTIELQDIDESTFKQSGNTESIEIKFLTK